MRSVDLSGISPGGKPGDDVELLEEAADDLVGVRRGTEPVELGKDLGERLLRVGDGALGVVLALLFKAALALHEFFTIESRYGVERRFTKGT